MTPLQRLRDLERQATPGEWKSTFREDRQWGEQVTMENDKGEIVLGTAYYDGLHAVMKDADGKFIASLRNIAPKLLELWEASIELHDETTYCETLTLATSRWLRALASLEGEAT